MGQCCSTSGEFENTMPRWGFSFELERAQSATFLPISCTGKTYLVISSQAHGHQPCWSQAKGNVMLGSGLGGAGF